MAVFRRKNRMFTLRLSAEEYESLHRLYRMDGSRSVSAFARSAMQKLIAEGETPRVAVETRLQDLDDKVVSLDHDVSRLIHLLESRVSSAGTALSAGSG